MEGVPLRWCPSGKTHGISAASRHSGRMGLPCSIKRRWTEKQSSGRPIFTSPSLEAAELMIVKIHRLSGVARLSVGAWQSTLSAARARGNTFPPFEGRNSAQGIDRLRRCSGSRAKPASASHAVAAAMRLEARRKRGRRLAHREERKAALE